MALNETLVHESACFFVSIRLGSPGWGRDGTSVKFNRPLDLNGFMTIALILHDWMKTY